MPGGGPNSADIFEEIRIIGTCIGILGLTWHGTGPLYKMGDMVLAQFIKWVAWYWPNL